MSIAERFMTDFYNDAREASRRSGLGGYHVKTADAARLLSMTEPRVIELVKAGTLRGVLEGRGYKILILDLCKYIEDRDIHQLMEEIKAQSGTTR